MCAICGIYDYRATEPVSRELVKQMMMVQAHRGPDGSGEYFDDAAGVGLGHRRLAIIDLDTGKQPMCNEDGTVWIVFNGEIYNYRELRSELCSRGHKFYTTSDTEVILHAYEEYGEECPEHFNGIFAFAIWDGCRRRLFLARDHFGVKPLYYHVQDGRFYFASEIKAILCDPAVPREMDLNALNMCLTFRHVPSPRTLFKDIYKLPPGCCLRVSCEGVKQWRYYKDLLAIDGALTEAEWVERLQVAVKQAVARQMISDVPIGVSLSSGVDSTTLLALMSQHSSEPVHAFTVGFEGREDASEIEPAQQMAVHFGANFYSKVISSQDYADFMDRYVWHLEEPVGNESAAAYYFVARAAYEQGVKVLLNGQGADEAFAGYRRYFGVNYGRWLNLATLPPVRQLLTRLFAGTSLGERYHHFLSSTEAGEEDERFLRIYSILTDELKHRLVRPEVLSEIEPTLPRQYVRDQLLRAPDGTALERMMWVDTRTSLPDNLLLCEDKMAMAASVEARVPFLDVEFMATAERIPGRFKLRGWRDKYIHRKTCAALVGQEVASRPQIGFDNAVEVWLRAQLGQHLREMIADPDSFTNTYLNQGYVLKLMQEHAECQRDHQRILFLLFSLESWYQVFVRGREMAVVST